MMHGRKNTKIIHLLVQIRQLYNGQYSCLESSKSHVTNFVVEKKCGSCRSQWPRGLRRGSVAARLLRLWVRIPLGTWLSDCCGCCVLSGRGLWDELITRQEESYRLWCVVCDLETSWMRRSCPAWGRSATRKETKLGIWVWEGRVK